MKVFPYWRAVGRAMRWVRQQEGVTAPRTVLDNVSKTVSLSLTWKREDGRSVELWWMRGSNYMDMAVKRKPPRRERAIYAGLDYVEDAATVLRVLAALDLIDADLAYGPDERYGKCVKCGRLAQWWHDSPFDPRWVHVSPLSAARPGVHRAEVAE